MLFFIKIHARVGGIGCAKRNLPQINTHPIIQLCTVVVQFKLLDLLLFALFLHGFCKEKRESRARQLSRRFAQRVWYAEGRLCGAHQNGKYDK